MRNKIKFSHSVEYNGIIFDSILEAKYAMYIEDNYAYYFHPPISIWYDKNDDTKLGKQTCRNEYKPDFLVRRLSDNKCFLVEIKSNRDRYHIDTLTKEDRAKKYIKKHKPNWDYKIITENDFDLSSCKFDKLVKAKNTRSTVARKKKFSRMHNKFGKQLMDYRYKKIPFNRHFKHLSDVDYLHFIKTGIMRDTAPD